MNACERARALLAVAPPDRSRDEQQSLDDHLSTCGDCREEAALFDGLDGLVGACLEAEALDAPAPRAWEPPTPTPVPETAPLAVFHLSQRFAALAAVAAAVLLVACGGLLFALGQAQAERDALRTQLGSLERAHAIAVSHEPTPEEPALGRVHYVLIDPTREMWGERRRNPGRMAWQRGGIDVQEF